MSGGQTKSVGGTTAMWFEDPNQQQNTTTTNGSGGDPKFSTGDGSGVGDWFPQIPQTIKYDPNAKTSELFVFRHYNANVRICCVGVLQWQVLTKRVLFCVEQEQILGRSMADWLRFSVCYWHTFGRSGTGVDMFGAPTIKRPWDDGTESMDNYKRYVWE